MLLVDLRRSGSVLSGALTSSTRLEYVVMSMYICGLYEGRILYLISLAALGTIDSKSSAVAYQFRH